MFNKIYVDTYILSCYYGIDEFSYISDWFNMIGRDFNDSLDVNRYITLIRLDVVIYACAFP